MAGRKIGLKHRGIRLLSGAGGTVAVLLIAARSGRTQAPAPQTSTAQTAENAINEYCSDCHNAQVKAGGIVLDAAALPRPGDQPGDHAELWERVIRQLAGKSMPPVGNPRPDDATYKQFRTYLEAELDRAAAAKPNPASCPICTG